MLGNPFVVVVAIVILLGGIILPGTKGGVERLNSILKIFLRMFLLIADKVPAPTIGSGSFLGCIQSLNLHSDLSLPPHSSSFPGSVHHARG